MHIFVKRYFLIFSQFFHRLWFCNITKKTELYQYSPQCLADVDQQIKIYDYVCIFLDIEYVEKYIYFNPALDYFSFIWSWNC